VRYSSLSTDPKALHEFALHLNMTYQWQRFLNVMRDLHGKSLYHMSLCARTVLDLFYHQLLHFFAF